MMQLNNTYKREDFLLFLEENFLVDFKKDIRPVNAEGFSSIQKAYSLGRSEDLDLTGKICQRHFLQIQRNRPEIRGAASFFQRPSH